MPQRRPAASATIVNCLQLLQLIPSDQAGLSPRELHSTGQQTFGWHFSRRTLDRYLNQLNEAGLIEVAGPARDERTGRQPQRWIAVTLAAGKSRLSAELAVAMVLLEKLARSLLPPELLGALDPQFRAANELIRVQRRVKAGLRWPEQVEYVTDSLRRVPQHVDPVVLRSLQEALLQGEQIECRYATAEDLIRNRLPRVSIKEVRGLVQRGATLYVVVTRPGKPEHPFTLRVDRFREVRRLSKTRSSSGPKSLREWVHDGLFDFPYSEGLQKFFARIDSDERLRLTEEPLSTDQIIHEDASGIHVTATVRDTRALENYILSRISHIAVIEPLALRERILGHLRRATEIYDSANIR